MRRACALGASIFLLCAVPAFAQSFPGEDVTVNPAALGRGYLLYPGGRYGRYVGPLLQPGERPGTIVRLHMPAKHRAVAHRAAPAAPDLASNAPLTVPDSTPAPARHRKARAPAAVASAAPSPPATGSINDMPENSAGRLIGSTPLAAPANPAPRRAAPTTVAPARRPAPDSSATGLVYNGPVPAKPRATPTPPPVQPSPDSGATGLVYNGPSAPAATPPRRMASTSPPPAASTPGAIAAGLRKQSSIAFAPGESSPATADVNAVHGLATSLNAALTSGATRVQLEAYGGPRGDKSSDSRRLSLKRALVIRELLIEDGVPSEKIDVRAMGGADDNGPADRVDVLVRS